MNPPNNKKPSSLGAFMFVLAVAFILKGSAH
jgi:hypothetical protein